MIFVFRIAFIFILVFGELLHWHWKASLISFLSVEKHHNPFNDLEELVKSNFQITLIAESVAQTVFESAKDGAYHRAWNTKFRKKDKSFRRDLRSMIDLVMKENFVVFDSMTSIKTLQEYKNCEIKNVGFSASKFENAFVLAKDSPYKKAFDRAVEEMHENGEMSRIWLASEDHYHPCGDSQGGKPIGKSSKMKSTLYNPIIIRHHFVCFENPFCCCRSGPVGVSLRHLPVRLPAGAPAGGDRVLGAETGRAAVIVEDDI